MTTFKTGNPVPSAAVKDLYDNAHNLDAGINGAAPTWTDRLGVVRRSWAGVLAEFDQFIADNGLKRYDSWAQLQADTSRDVGFAADIIGDAGTHVDPVSGATVPNSGQYRWNGSAWEFLRADMLALKANYSAVALTSGDLFSSAVPRAAAGTGGAVIMGDDNRNVGFRVPAGATGATAYIAADIPAAAARGRIIRVTQIYRASDSWLALANLGNVQAQSYAAGVVTTVVATNYHISQSGTTVTQSAILLVPENADRIGLVVQLASNAAARDVDREIELVSVGYVEQGQSGVATEQDKMLDIRLGPLSESVQQALTDVANAMLTSGDVFDQPAAGAGGVSNGAVRILDGQGRTVGFTIPAGSGGGSSYVTAWFDASGLAGHRLRITTKYAVSDGFLSGTSYSSTALQVNRGSIVNVAPESRLLTQEGLVLTQVTEYTVGASDQRLGASFQVSSGHPARAYERSIRIVSVVYQIIPNGIETSNDAMLRAYVAKAIADAAGNTDEGYAVTLTVKPSGGDYTHPKLALDAITDASAAKRYKIAVYPGTYTGYAEWHTKDWVDIIGVGRRDEIVVSYELPGNASAAEITSTSLLWLASQTELRNMTLWARNVRYVIHAESNSNRPGITCSIINCAVEHRGNKSAVNNTWWQPSQYAVGAGNSSGQKIIVRGSHLAGPGGGMSYHLPNSGVPYDSPTFTDLEGNTFVNTGDQPGWNAALSIKPVAPGAGDDCRIVGNKFVGDVYYAGNSEWVFPGDTTTNRAQIRVWGYGNTGFNFVNRFPAGTPAADYFPEMT